MATPRMTALDRLFYEEAAEAYLRSLPPEHFMEHTAQATQRKITVESFDQIHRLRPDIQCFNELLVQYPRTGLRDVGQVVPDNMVVVCRDRLDPGGSYDLPRQPVGPTLVLEYVSKRSKRKDYEDNFRKYEQELKAPYYLIFYPDDQELTLFRLKPRKGYVSVLPGADGRHPIPELDLAVALLDEWARFWFRGRLLPLTADLAGELDEAKRELRVARRQARAAEEQARAAEEQVREEKQAREVAEAELARLRDELNRLRGGG